MKHVIVFITVLCSLFCKSLVAEKIVDLPNILIIYADDLGYGDVSYQNRKSKIRTPHIDKLAVEGMQFTDAHSSSAHCSPSRYALLTGRYHWRRMYDIVFALGEPAFTENEFTIARMLQHRGYTTACIGKWHLGWNWQFHSEPKKLPRGRYCKPSQLVTDQVITGGPLDQGFDYYFGDGTINFPPYAWIENDRFVEAPTVDMTLENWVKPKEGNWQFRKGPMVADWNPYLVLPTLADKVEQYISRQQSNKPFFLYFALPSPHAPIIPTEEYLGRSEAGPYGDYVEQTDDVVGRVLKALQNKGLDENTIVIFSSDNGPEKFAFDRIHQHNHRSMAHLRGLKRDKWEGGHRVPFVVKWPSHIEPGAKSDETICQTDILATIANIVGYELNEEQGGDSYDITPVLFNKAYQSPLREATVHNEIENRFAIRVGDWVLIDCFTGEISEAPDWYYSENNYERYDRSNPGLLFNLEKDPEQRNNLYEQYPEKVELMQKLLRKYRRENKSKF